MHALSHEGTLNMCYAHDPPTLIYLKKQMEEGMCTLCHYCTVEKVCEVPTKIHCKLRSGCQYLSSVCHSFQMSWSCLASPEEGHSLRSEPVPRWESKLLNFDTVSCLTCFFSIVVFLVHSPRSTKRISQKWVVIMFTVCTSIHLLLPPFTNTHTHTYTHTMHINCTC